MCLVQRKSEQKKLEASGVQISVEFNKVNKSLSPLMRFIFKLLLHARLFFRQNSSTTFFGLPYYGVPAGCIHPVVQNYW